MLRRLVFLALVFISTGFIVKNEAQDGGDHVVVRSERTKSYLLYRNHYLAHSQLWGREEKLGKYEKNLETLLRMMRND